MAPHITRRQFVRGAASLAALSLLNSCSRVVPGVAKRSPTAVPPDLLLDALKSEDLAVQSDAARLLGELGSPKAVGPLVRYVKGSRRYVKTAGLDALAQIGDKSVCVEIRPLVREPNVFDDHFWYGRCSVQVAAALALLELGDEAGMDLLMDPDYEHKEWALFTWFGPTVMRLPDKSAAVRKLKGRFTVEKVLPESKTDPGQFVVICDTLGGMATLPAHRAPARRALAGLTDHLSRYVRGRAAVNLLAASGRPEHAERVRKMAAADKTLFARVKASQALVIGGRPAHAERIAEAARSAKDDFDRAAALDSLGVIARVRYVGLIAEQSSSKNPYVRLCAAGALDRIGTRAAISAAARRQNDPDLRVRLQIAKCLAAHA